MAQYWFTPDADPTGSSSPIRPPIPGGPSRLIRPPGGIMEWGKKQQQKQKQKSIQDLINSDPTLAALRAQLGAEGVQDAATRKAGIQRALIALGFVPDFSKFGGGADLGYLGTDIDDVTRSLAEENTRQGLSLKAKLDKALKQNNIDLTNQLANQGILESGSTGYGLNENAQDYKVALSDTEGDVINTILGLISAFTEGERARKQRELDELEDAADRAAAEDPGEEPEVDLDGEPTKKVVKKVKKLPTSKQLKKGTKLTKLTKSKLKSGRI